MNKTDIQALLFGMGVFSKPRSELLKLIENWENEKNGVLKIATPNPEQIVQSLENPEFLGFLNQFDILLPDGQGLVVASKVLSRLRPARFPVSITHRIAGREVVAELVHRAQATHQKVLIIGGRGYEGQPLLEKDTIKWLPAYQNIKQPTVAEEIAVKNELLSFQPDYVFVAFGAPFQERWVIEHQAQLKEAQVKVVMVVGGSFDSIFGLVPSVPAVVTQFGLEWLFRLITQPWRWRRQLRLVAFVGLFLQELFSFSPSSRK